MDETEKFIMDSISDDQLNGFTAPKNDVLKALNDEIDSLNDFVSYTTTQQYKDVIIVEIEKLKTIMRMIESDDLSKVKDIARSYIPYMISYDGKLIDFRESIESFFTIDKLINMYIDYNSIPE